MKNKLIDFYWKCYRFRRGYLRWRYFYYGFRNLWYYFPVIWNDRDYDHSFFIDLIHRKLKRMEYNFRYYCCHVGSKRDADNIKKAVLICERIQKNEYYTNPIVRVNGKFVDQEKQDVQYLCDILNKHLLEWWD